MIYNVAQYGAIGDNSTNSTSAFQEALDTCSRNGGGTVLVPPGTFRIGTIHLRSHIEFHIAAGATVIGSSDIRDYSTDTHHCMYEGESHMDRCLIFARDESDFCITGSGTIDGNGHTSVFPNTDDSENQRPMLIRFLRCSRITLRDISLINPAGWTSAWLYCDEIIVSSIRIRSRVNLNGDGLDFDGCTNVCVSNSSFDTSDDSICLQASHPDYPCRNIVISNCLFSSQWAGLRIGLLTLADITEVSVSNCIFRDIADSGIKIQLCEGATIGNMVFSNLVMRNVPRPVFMTFNRQRASTETPDIVPEMTVMSGFIFESIRIECDADMGSGQDSGLVFSGVPGKRITGIRLSDIDFIAPGGATAISPMVELAEFSGPDTSDGIARMPDGRELTHYRWPEYEQLGGTLPAYGVFARHVGELSISRSRFKTRMPDGREPIVCQDSVDLEIDGQKLSDGVYP